MSRRLLCNALIQPHFDYGCTSWYPDLSTIFKTKLEIAQNKCIHFCFGLPLHGHISPLHFRKINWFPVTHRVDLCTSTTVFKYWKIIAPSYLNDMLMPSLNNYNTRSKMALDIPLCRTNKGQKCMQFLGPKIWNRLSSNKKTPGTVASVWKKKFLRNCSSEQFYWFLLTVDCFFLLVYPLRLYL